MAIATVLAARGRARRRALSAGLAACLLAAPAAAPALAAEDYATALSNRAPTADPGAAPKVVEPRAEATFDGRASSDPDGRVVDAVWDFGDGSNARGIVARHAYERPGAYMAQLTVHDDHGAVASQPLAVHVGPQPRLLTEDVNVPVAGGYPVHARITRPDDGERHPVVVRYSIYCASFNLGDEALVRSGYVFIHAEAPGVCGSGGAFDLWGPEVARAGYDLVEWAAARPWSDGKVGLVGHSGPAITGLAAARARPPHLRTVVLGSTLVDAYRDVAYPGGVPTTAAPAYNAVLAAEPRPGMDPLARSQGWVAWERDVLSHPFDDEFWQPRSLAADFADLEVPAYLITSWNDLFTRGTFEFFRNRADPRSRVAIYPGPHWSFDPAGTMGYRATGDQDIHAGSEERVWLDRRLRGIGGDDPRPPLAYYVQRGGGAAAQAFSNGEWRFADEWPPAGTRWQRLYLRTGGRIEASPPPAAEPGETLVAAPAGAGEPQWIDFWAAGGHRATDGRPFLDVPEGRVSDAGALTFTTEDQREPLEVAGPITLSFTAALAGSDGAFFATLSDVWPDGSAHVLSSGVLRASMRAVDEQRSLRNADGEIVRVWHPHDRREPLVPGQDARYVVELWPTANTFAPGHRLRVSLSLLKLPWFAPDALAPAATLRHGPAQPPSLLLPVVS